ncbi:MAG: hypothetical protein HUN04_14525 [Desulfobacter sp.]|nr:MAG: hypothetical protein HUN04_14525 [Desulfobacter sp.]
MSYNRFMSILRSKLIPPVPGNTLSRNRLADGFISSDDITLTQIVAGAGFGKTTLAAQMLAASETRTAWYRLDEFDRDFSLFMTYMTKALEAAFPGSDLKLPPPPSPAMPAGKQKRWLLEWTAALDAGIPGNCVIVLDDYHLVEGEINTAVEFILDRLPRGTSLMLISRRPPGLKISRLRAGRRVLDIHEKDLAFTEEETRRFFTEAGSSRFPDPSALGAIHKKTQGWAAGLVLFSCAMGTQRLKDISKDLGRLPESRTHVFDYLEENIFEAQSPERQAFMVKTAVLEFMDTDFCDGVLGIRESGDIFREMASQHLMVFPVDGSETGFYYHHLFRDFLRAKAAEVLGPETLGRVHLAAATILAGQQHPLALHHYIEAGDYAAAAGMLSDLEVQFLLKGQMPFVKECLERIPARIRAAQPQILFMSAKQASYYGRPDRAIESLISARRLFLEQEEPEQAVKCLADLGAQYYYTGCIPEAKGLMEQVLSGIRPDSPTYILVMTYLVFFAGVLGEIELSEKYESDAREVVGLYPEPQRRAAEILIGTSVTYRLYITGEMLKSSRLNQWLVKESKRTGFAACLPLAYYQSATTDYYLGRYEAGAANAREGIRTAEQIHLRDSQKGWIYLAWAENCMGLEQWKRAGALVRRGLEIFQGPGNRWGEANALNVLARLSMRHHRLSEAEEYIDRALGVIRDRGIDFPMAIVQLTRARILFCRKDYQGALAVLAPLEAALEKAAHYQGLARLLTAKCRIALGKAGPEAYDMAVERIRRFGGKAGWADWAESCILSHDLQEEKKIQRVPACRAKAPESGDQPGGLRIQLLGRFQLAVGDREIRPDDWTHANALHLFKYLAAHRDKGYLPKDLLMEVLWPEQDARRTAKRFNVATSRLRKILEPNLPPRARSAYILRRRDQYRLSLGPGGSCDLERFLFHAGAARTQDGADPGAREGHCLEAAAQYRGPFLEDTLYEDWCNRKREAMTMEYCRILRQLIRCCQDRGDWEGMVKWTRTGLGADPFDEAMHQTLMSAYAGLGQYDRVARCYEHCRRQMESMDCRVSPKTRMLFSDIMSRQL